MVAALGAGIGGCSLVTLKSPEKPLSTRDLNARILTREYSAKFIDAVEKSADSLVIGEEDPELATNALRWKVGAATESVRAATQIAPMMGLIDTWALALQMRDFFAEGNTGGNLFGQHQAAVREVSDVQAQNADALAERIIAPKDFQKYHEFVTTYVRRYPLQDLSFERTSIVQLWSAESGADVRLVDSLGTIPEAMTDFADRIKIYGDTVPSQAVWRTELALRDSGYTRLDLRKELAQLDERMDRMTVVAENAPELVHSAVADVRRTLIDIIDKVNQSTATMMSAFHDERVDLTADIQAERAKALVALDEQRKALTVDAARISNQVVITAGRELRKLALQAVLLLVFFSVVALGLPFAAGYFVGRGRRAPPG
jgi:hypothetical protein